MQDLQELGELYQEGVFTNAVNNTGRRTFNGAVNTVQSTIPNGRRHPNGRFRKEPFISKVYNAVENGLEKLVGLGSSALGYGMSEDISQLKAKIYYVVLRQQPPVGVAFKKVLQQRIYDATSVADLDKIAAEYKAWQPWVSYKRYLEQHSR